MSTLDKSSLKIFFKEKDHYEHPRVLKDLTVIVKHPAHGEVASLTARRIVRNACPGDFLRVLDEETDEMATFSTKLFDKYGKVLPEHIELGYQSGSGCWGRELDEGTLIYVFWVSVEEQFRGQGIGSWMLQRFTKSKHVAPDDTVICWPSPIRVEDRAMWNAIHQRQVAFFRQNDFRRIGRTAFFGYSPKDDHPSRLVPAGSDAAAPQQDFPNPTPDATPEQMRQSYPLHWAIANDKTSAIISTVQSAYNSNAASITAPDALGFTPLHMAAGKARVDVVQLLLELGAASELENARNQSGLTPLELLQGEMRATFTRRCWRTGTDAPAGGCGGGWLSPRMRYRLECEAGYARDMMPDDYDYFTRGKAARLSDIAHIYKADFIPPRFESDFFLSFYKGFQDVFSAIYDLLHTTTHPLSAEAIQPFLLPESQFYFKKGGRIEYAFDAITFSAYIASPLVDDTHEDIFRDVQDWTSLPTCVNDLEFTLVRNLLGLDGRGQWGPYEQERAVPRAAGELFGMMDLSEDGDEEEEDEGEQDVEMDEEEGEEMDVEIDEGTESSKA
ncbi:Ankyrin repeat family protein [Mycena kentingensis (nom. inval.)]|nr:Ankyrin repeat family protein [Mycena kentingensis (nom. inval.)]